MSPERVAIIETHLQTVINNQTEFKSYFKDVNTMLKTVSDTQIKHDGRIKFVERALTWFYPMVILVVTCLGAWKLYN